ncbi:hypothetical protein CGRA01v4_02549 [Colletotrichum graminicola]|nr:hypothetical protein CGRA01v4_02549 [Colletotrichum graminicola]
METRCYGRRRNDADVTSEQGVCGVSGCCRKICTGKGALTWYEGITRCQAGRNQVVKRMSTFGDDNLVLG